MFSRTYDVRHVGILFSFCYKLGQASKKNNIVFFSLVVRFRLVILFYSYFFVFPNIKFSNRSDSILRIKLSSSSCNLILSSGENCLLFGRRPNRLFWNRHAIRANVNKPSDGNVCRALCHNTAFIFVTYTSHTSHR